MLDNKKTLRAAIVLSALFLALILNGIFTLGSAKNNPVSAWNSSPAYNGESVYEPDYVVLSMNGRNANGDSIYQDNGSTRFYVWLNVGRISDDNGLGYATVKLKWAGSATGFSNSVSSSIDIKVQKGVKSVDSTDENYQYSWFKTELTYHNNYWQVSTENQLEINEIVFTSVDGEVMQTALEGAMVWKNDSERSYVSADDLPENCSAKGLIDEQGLFKKYSPLAKKYNFTSAEANTVNAALTFANNDAQFIDSTSGAFGLELIWLGIGIFGVNTVGVRIIPYIFFLLTVGLMFTIGRKLFADSDAGLLMSVFYSLLGLGISVGSLGIVASMAVFFSLLSVYFMLGVFSGATKYTFTKSKHSFKAGSTALLGPVLLSALAFSFAFNCSVYSLFVLPAVVAAYLAGVFKVKKVHAFNDSVAADEFERTRNLNQQKINIYGTAAAFVAAFIIFTLVVTLLFYGIVGYNYTEFYGGGKNLMQAIFANLGSAFKGGVSATFLKWAVGGGSTLIYSAGSNVNNFNNVYIAMNIAVQLVALASFVYSTVVFIKKFTQSKAGEEARKSFKNIIVPYCVLLAGALFGWLPFAFIAGANTAYYLLSSVFLMGFIPFAYKSLVSTGKTVKVGKGEVTAANLALYIAFALAVLFFAIGYVLFAGIQVNAIAAKILFTWWLF